MRNLAERAAMPVFVLAMLTLLAGICVLPYAFPPRVFVKGASYEAGFNNSVAYLWYVLFLWLPVLLLSRLIPYVTGEFPSLSAWQITRKPSLVFWIVLGLHAGLFVGLYAVKGQFVFSESLYFQTLLYRMTLGDVPYLDFSFYYGPAMLYPGYLLARALGIEQGYALCFIANYLVGLYLLYIVVRAVVLDKGASDRWFMLFAIGLFNPWTGLNVTFLRYLLPVIAFASAVAYFRAGSGRSLAWATAWLAFAMLYTFEAGSVAVVSIVLLVVATMYHQQLVRAVQWLVGIRQKDYQHETNTRKNVEPRGSELASPRLVVRRAAMLMSLAVLLCVAGFYAVDPSLRALRLYPEIALSYSAGAHNMPIAPSLPLLTLVALTLVGLAGVLLAAGTGEIAGREGLAMGWLILGLLMERGAFGVAEPGHFAYYGLPVFFLCLCVVCRVESWAAARIWLAVLLVGGIAVPLQYYNATLFVPIVGSGRASVGAPTNNGGNSFGREVTQRALTTLVEQIGRDKPYLMYELDYYSFPVYRKLGLRYPTYFTLLSNARTDEDMQLIINQLMTSRAIILAKEEDLAPSQPSIARLDWERWLDWLTGAHVSGSYLGQLMQNSHSRLQEPLREFILSAYEIVRQHDGFVALAPRSTRIP